MELSKKMANFSLIPELERNPNAPVVANGFSCRQQIRALTDHQPRHLAQVLCEALDVQDAP